MADETNKDVKRAFDALSQKKPIYDQLWKYYDGLQPLVYSNDRLKEVFQNINARFRQNWCGVVVDSVIERLEFKQFNVLNDETATETLNEWWVTSEMELDADDVELCAIVTGESFVMVWPGAEGVLEAYYNDSRMVHVFYQADNPRQMEMAAKWFTANDGTARLTLYYPERLEYYASNKKAEEITGAEAFFPLLMDGNDLGSYMAPNPLGQIPIFHFRRERRAIKSELSPAVLDTQDAVNKLFADMMVAAEYGAFKQRYIISAADVGNLKNSPNEIWDLPAGDGLSQPTTVGEFAETNLSNFMDAMERLAASIGKTTRTPLYYFDLGKRADPSGETLMAMDAPLVKKTQNYIKRFQREWERLARFVAPFLSLPMGDIQAVYADPRTIQPLTEAQTRKTNVESGIPLNTNLRREGWTPQELAQMAADKQAESSAQQQTLGLALLNAQRQFSQPAPNGVNANA